LSLLLIFPETDGSGHDHEDGGDGKEKPPKGRRNTDDEKKDRFKKLNGETSRMSTMSETNTKLKESTTSMTDVTIVCANLEEVAVPQNAH